MGRAAVLAGLFLAVTLFCGVDLALGNTAKLQIGVKHRPKECIAKAKAGDSVEVHYTGTLAADGSKFDSSLDRNQPFRFTLGRGQVIKGWDQGIAGMCIGEKRRLKIPSHLGYGDQGSPPKIPGGATLIFETELMGIDGVPSTA